MIELLLLLLLVHPHDCSLLVLELLRLVELHSWLRLTLSRELLLKRLSRLLLLLHYQLLKHSSVIALPVILTCSVLLLLLHQELPLLLVQMLVIHVLLVRVHLLLALCVLMLLDVLLLF